MRLSEEQIVHISSSILVSDILAYIESHRSEYEEFVKEENQKEKEVILYDKNKAPY